MLKGFVVAIASGKGGTGKTTVATNLAQVAAGLGHKVQYLDCDVEEPNGHIFLKPQITGASDIFLNVPKVDPEKCVACEKCGQICEYSAIVCINEHVLTFEQLCHSCGGCWRICPVGAIDTRPLKIGSLEFGRAGQVDFVAGKLRVGHVRTPALIKEVKKHTVKDCLAIIDVPPGTSCPVVQAVRNVDFVLLVTEPTPFGLHDLKLAVELLRQMNLPFAVVINRYGVGNDEVEKYCAVENIKIVMKLPDDRRIAQAYSSGKMVTNELPEYESHFVDLAKALKVR
jgi:MinD superfamily P-loop ATPase